MAVLENLEPKKVFQFFEAICAIPHGSFDTKRVSDYCVDFAKARGLEWNQDEYNNVIIKKAGTEGYEESAPVIVQGHLDMVCEKVPGSTHDFKTDGIELVVEDDYITANGTTLGADNGIAVAMALALLDSDDIPHPPIEALFTVEEEVGMLGAEKVDLNLLDGKTLINIDSEEEGVLTTGCAGAVTLESTVPIRREEKSGEKVSLRIAGLLGGHSGVEIHKQRGNSHKMMTRLLSALDEKVGIDVISIDGGSKDNVIAFETRAEILVPEADLEKVRSVAEEVRETFENELYGVESGIIVEVTADGAANVKALDTESKEKVLGFLTVHPNGLWEYSRTLPGFTESSLNIGVVNTQEDSVKVVCMARSSVETRKNELWDVVKTCGKLVGATVVARGIYPAWQYNPNSKILKVMTDTYKDLYGKEPEISAVHAGLECGLFLGKRPDFDCISVGPDMPGVHSVDERLYIKSTERTWNFLKAVLANLK